MSANFVRLLLDHLWWAVQTQSGSVNGNRLSHKIYIVLWAGHSGFGPSAIVHNFFACSERPQKAKLGYKLRPILPHSVQLEHVGPVLLCAVSPALNRCAHATSAGEMPHPRTIAGRRRDVTKIQRVSHYVATLAFSAIVRGALKLADVFRIALQHQAPSEL